MRTILTTLGILLGLTAATTALAFVDLGRLHGPAAMAIAATKAALVLGIFMHLRGGPRLFWAVAGAAVFCFGTLLVLTLSDVLSRGWLGG